ncbi:MAG TPA: hypothetical protein VLA13_09680 [Massilibacterium sp.]|nr:hypothetical protein [Massilibacterium sp.]
MIKRKKTVALLFIVLFSFGLIYISYNHLGNPKLILVNVGHKDIDSVYVTVTGNSYFINTLKKGTETELRIDPKADSDIKLTTENRRYTIIINTYLGRGSTGGYIRAEITTDSLITFVHKRGLL